MPVPDEPSHVHTRLDAGRERLPDALRGFALLGIVVVNAPFLLSSSDGFTPDAVASGPDRVAAFAVVAFAQAKFYLLFSFLFGYSLVLLLRGAGDDGGRRYRRRLVGLAVLGVAHAVLLFVGDILLTYAVLGSLLVLALRWSDRTALRAAAGAFLVAWALLGLVVLDAAADSANGGFVPDGAALDAALRESFTQAAAGRLSALPGVLLVLAVLNGPSVVAMFLLGLVAGRRGVLARPEEHRRLWRRLLVLAAVVGLPGGIASGVLVHGPGATPGSLRELVGIAVGFATAPALTGGYVACLAMAHRSRLLRFFEPVGRLSLSAYLGESLLLSAIACGWGLGLLGGLGAAAVTGVAVTVWLLLDVLARWWGRRYRYGPAEWMLRGWTLGRRVPLGYSASGAEGPPRARLE